MSSLMQRNPSGFRLGLNAFGHTHVGQFKIPFTDFAPLSPVKDLSMTEGLHEFQNRKIFITRGVKPYGIGSIVDLKQVFWNLAKFIDDCPTEEGKNTGFPNPNKFDNKKLVAISQPRCRKNSSSISKWYFPMDEDGTEPLLVVSPNPRMVLVPSEMKISKSLRRIIDSGKFEIRIDSNFESTMKACAQAKRPNEEGTWIEEDMISDYSELHKLGHAHSIEAYQDDQLVGGLYGLAMGRVFLVNLCFMRLPTPRRLA